MKIFKESDILDEGMRKRIIDEIRGQENQNRKRDAHRAYEVYKDQTKKYVIEKLSKEMEVATVEEMKSRAANISLCKKIVNKKARIYKTAPKRIALDNEMVSQAQVELLYSLTQFNSKAKNLNRFYELRNNSALQIVPVESEGKYYLSVRALPDFLYDVIENANDPEKPFVFITSPFVDNQEEVRVKYGNHRFDTIGTFQSGDGREQIIADSPNDTGKENLEFIWWSKNYHFTTNAKGQIVQSKSPEDLLNPIKMLNFVTAAKSQDGEYWARGSEDLVDGSVLINVLLTDLYFIAKIQGMGTFYYFGKDAAKDRKVGPNHGFFVEIQEGDPTPSIGFATSNPPLESHMRMIEQYIALLLSTNDLSSDMVSGRLDAANAASGIQQLINRAEVTSAIEDELSVFLNVEAESFKILRAWHNLYWDKKLLTQEFSEIGRVDESLEIAVKFSPAEEYVTEEQRLNLLEKRLNLGLEDLVGAIMADNPDMGEEDAKEKLKEMLKRKLELSRLNLLSVEQQAKEQQVKQSKDIEDAVEDMNSDT